MIKAKESLLGVRIETTLKRKMDEFCKKRGISRKFFVQQAVLDKLYSALEDETDLQLGLASLNNDDELISWEQAVKNLKKAKKL